jgi:hypothetical protein
MDFLAPSDKIKKKPCAIVAAGSDHALSLGDFRPISREGWRRGGANSYQGNRGTSLKNLMVLSWLHLPA